MGRIFVVDLEGRTYNCKFCKTHLALVEDVISKAFYGLMGKAYLFNNEAVHDKNQKYKEGKFVLERGRIFDGVDPGFYIDTSSNVNDREEA